MSDKYETAISFLNDNLEEYFKKKDYSLIGTKARIDSMGEVYKTYSFLTHDIPGMTGEEDFEGLQCCLDQIKLNIDNLLSGLIQAKTVEKLEGSETKTRDVQVHWRIFPYIQINEGDFENAPKMAVFFRISLHHKQSQETR